MDGMKIISISDTHQSYPFNLPEGDVLIHTGDYSFLPKSARYNIELMKQENYLKA